MISVDIPEKLTKAQRYALITAKLKALLAAESDALANLCNFMAYLYWTMGCVNWVGVYVMRGGELVLGPFAGKPACTRIALGKGVCGAAAASSEVQLVPDVHLFPGHIACDDASQSELVIPLKVDGTLWGVLDMDSPEANRFNAEDQAAMEKIAALVEDLAAHVTL